MDSNKDRHKEKREIYLEILKDNSKSRIREGNKRDQAFLTVTTGSLALSVAFLTISNVEIEGGFYIIFSWVLLITSIIFTLSSYIIVDFHFSTQQRKLIDWGRKGMDNSEIPPETNHWTTVTNIFNAISYLATIFGLILLVLFGIINISIMNKNNQKITTDESQSEKFANPLSSSTPLQEQLENTKPKK